MQASVAAAVVTGVANRVLYKLALVPMGDYVFVLSQFQTFGYCLVYFSFLFSRFRWVLFELQLSLLLSAELIQLCASNAFH